MLNSASEKRKEIVKSGILVKARTQQSALAQNILATLLIKVKVHLDKQRYVDHNLNDKCKLIDKTLIPDWADLSKIPLEYHVSKIELAELWDVNSKTLRDKTRKEITKNGDVKEYSSPIKSACIEVMSSIMEVNTFLVSNTANVQDLSKTADGWSLLSLVTKADFNQNGLTLKLNPDALPIIYDESYGFASTDLKIFFKLKSQYAKRWYELLCRYKDYGRLVESLSVGELEKMFCKQRSEYKQPNTFFTTIFDTPLKEIIKVSEEFGGDKIWVLPEAYKKPYTVERSARNRTSVHDKVIINLHYVKRPTHAVNELPAAEPLGNDIKDAVNIIKDLRCKPRAITLGEKKLLETLSNQLVRGAYCDFIELATYLSSYEK